ncbi:hypothetical protein Sjap_004932 [Stephania japonica]|uniref:Uncharacterized protein n=1 Tax=Stephania japonica TaxID=461633 RepID=A0AAP0PJJ8_9MAGN
MCRCPIRQSATCCCPIRSAMSLQSTRHVAHHASSSPTSLICLGMRAQPHSQIFARDVRFRPRHVIATWQPLVRTTRHASAATTNQEPPRVSAYTQHVTRSPLQFAAATSARSSFSANHAVTCGRVQKTPKNSHRLSSTHVSRTKLENRHPGPKFKSIN